MKKLFYIPVMFLTIIACKKENNANTFEGNYEGTFRTQINNQYTVVDAEIKLSSPSFTVVKGPKMANGNFNVEDKLNITFTDTNTWQPDFDWNIVLNGTYKYQTLGDSLILTKYVNRPNNDVSCYQYRLKRRN